MDLNADSQGKRTSLRFFVAILLLVLILSLRMVAPYLLSILMGAVLTVLVGPLFKALRARRVGPKLAAGLVVAIVILVIVGPLSAFLIVAIRQAIALGERLATNEAFSLEEILNRLAAWGPVSDLFGDVAALERQARTAIQGAGKFLSTALLSSAGKLPNLILQLFLALITCFFLLLDGKRFVLWVKQKIPLDEEVQTRLSASYRDTAISVIWSTLAAAAAQASLMGISYAILGVPGAILATGATFIFAWIPIVGSTPVWIAGCVYLFTKGAIAKIIVMAILGLITGVVDNFIRPLVLKGRSDMHPLISLVAIFGGIGMFGILGVFFGPIIAALLISLLEVWGVVGERFGILKRKTLETPADRPT